MIRAFPPPPPPPPPPPHPCKMTRVTPGGTIQVVLDVKVMKFSGWAAAIPFDNGEDASIIHNSARRIGFLPSLFPIWPTLNHTFLLVSLQPATLIAPEAIIIKRRDKPYRSGRSPDWIKVKNQDAPAASRIMEW